MKQQSFEINNIDIIVYLEKPHLSMYKEAMKNYIAYLLKTDSSNVNIKATRKEGLGYIGRMEGISAESVVLLKSKGMMKKL